MKHLLRYLSSANLPRCDLLLHLGAGDGGDLPELRRLGARRLCLVEANPAQRHGLERKADARRGEQVLGLAVTPFAAPATLKLINNPRESSILPIAGLADYFPNLAQSGELSVEGMTLDALLLQLQLDHAGHNILLIELAGIETAVLDATPDPLLQAFAYIGLRVGSVPLYLGGGDSASAHARLTDLGFALCQRDPNIIEPHQHLLYQRDPDKMLQRQRYLALQAELAESRARAATLERQVNDLTATHQERQRLLELDNLAQRDLLAAREQDLSALTARLQQREAELDELRGTARDGAQRQQQLSMEMVRAEAQIGLIRDLLLKNGGL